MSFGPPFLNPFSVSSAASQLLLNPASLAKPANLPGTSTTSVSLSSSITSATGATAAADMSAETLRFLSAGHPALPAHMGFQPRFDGPMPTVPGMDPRAMGHLAPFGFYAGLPGAELKSPDGLGGPQTLPGYYYDPALGPGYPYGGGPLDLNGARRKNATRETTAALKAWLYEHRKNPYPTKGEKIMLAIITKMTLTQVSTWFANARRRLKKENKMTWSPRNRPGEDDDDDIGAGEDLGPDRSASSLSNHSDLLPPDGATLLKDGEPREEEANGERNNNTSKPASAEERLQGGSEKRPASEDPPAELVSPPKKPKIWSIADTMASSSHTRSVTPPLPASSAPAPTVDATALPSVPTCSTSKKESVGGGGGPVHFTFNPWQQQMAAAAANAGAFNMVRPPTAAQFGFAPVMGNPVAAFAQLRPELFAAARANPSGFLPAHPAFFGMGPSVAHSAANPVSLGLVPALPSVSAATTQAAIANHQLISGAKLLTSTVSPVSSTGAELNGTQSPKENFTAGK